MRKYIENTQRQLPPQILGFVQQSSLTCVEHTEGGQTKEMQEEINNSIATWSTLQPLITHDSLATLYVHTTRARSPQAKRQTQHLVRTLPDSLDTMLGNLQGLLLLVLVQQEELVIIIEV